MTSLQRLLLRVCPAILCLAAPLASQAVGGGFLLLDRREGAEAADQLGTKAVVVGDVDADGVPDLAASALTASPGGRAAAGSVSVFSGASGALLHRFDGENALDRFGFSVAEAGDVDQDGHDDVLVGTPFVVYRGKSEAGAVYLFSGDGGGLLFRFDGSERDEQAGWSVAGGRDLDGDAVPDIVWGAQHAPDPQNSGLKTGYTVAISGVTGQPLWTTFGPHDHAHCGASLAFTDDVDGDGVSDLLMGINSEEVNGVHHAGSVHWLSGASGALLRRFDGDLEHGHFGASVAVLGDVDGDAFPDLAASGPRADLPSGLSKAGYVRVFSGIDGAILHERMGTQDDQNYGISLAGVGDVDGDGLADFVIGAHTTDVGARDNAGSVWIHSGASGAVILRVDGTLNGDRMGSALSGMADADGDGIDDLLIGAMGVDSAGGVADAGVVLVGTWHPFLTVDQESLSAASGGTLEYAMRFPPSEASQSYWTLFSAEGTGPTNYRGVDVPLTRDSLFKRAVSGNYPPGATNLTGVLDSSARASSSLVLVAGSLAGLVGSSLHAAVMTYNPTGGGRLSSAAASVAVEP